jgi:hypothetical protein
MGLRSTPSTLTAISGSKKIQECKSGILPGTRGVHRLCGLYEQNLKAILDSHSIRTEIYCPDPGTCAYVQHVM